MLWSWWDRERRRLAENRRRCSYAAFRTMLAEGQLHSEEAEEICSVETKKRTEVAEEVVVNVVVVEELLYNSRVG